MDIVIIYKIILFWTIFFISPGPVWIAIMEATRQSSLTDIFGFYLKIFLPANIFVQVTQALVCVIFVKVIIEIFAQVGILFYILGGSYILYLAYKTLKSKQKNTSLELTLANLALVVLLSPKIWLLFPSGADIANQLNQGIVVNAIVYVLIMFIISNLALVLYVGIGKVGTKILGNNFSYLTFGLLVLFSLFLFNEVLQAII